MHAILDRCAHGCGRVFEGACRTCETCGAAVCPTCADDACPAWSFMDFIISPDPDHPFGGWQYVHREYNGPPDPRCGHAATVLQAKIEIEDLCDA